MGTIIAIGAGIAVLTGLGAGIGIGIANFNDVKEADVIECFIMEEIER